MMYQNFASPPFGERTLSYFMSSDGEFHHSLLKYVHTLHHISQSPSNRDYGTFLSLKNRVGSLKKIVIIWGIHDKWYFDQYYKNEIQEKSQFHEDTDDDNLPHSTQDSHVTNGNIIQKNPTEELLEYFQFNGIQTELYEITHVSFFKIIIHHHNHF